MKKIAYILATLILLFTPLYAGFGGPFSGSTGSRDAADITVSVSGMTATNVQAAIQELYDTVVNTGSGDILSVGDCTTGAALDGSSDGGTYIRLYDGNSHYTQISAGDSTANLTYTFPTAAAAGNNYLLRVSTAGAMSTVDPATFESHTSDDIDVDRFKGDTTDDDKIPFDLLDGVQAYDADLTSYAGVTPHANALTLLGHDFAGMRTDLGLVIGTNVQAYDDDLADLADGSLTGSKVGDGIDDDYVSFDDADNLWTATKIGPALEELNDSINEGACNGTGAKVHWSQLTGVPAGFADGTDE